MKRSERLQLIYKELEQLPPAASALGVFQLLEKAFDKVEDLHSGVVKNPDAHKTRATDGRMYPPHPEMKPIPNVTPTTYRHVGHKTAIDSNGSFRIFQIEADLTETVVFEKRGADNKGYWE